VIWAVFLNRHQKIRMDSFKNLGRLSRQVLALLLIRAQKSSTLSKQLWVLCLHDFSDVCGEVSLEIGVF